MLSVIEPPSRRVSPRRDIEKFYEAHGSSSMPDVAPRVCRIVTDLKAQGDTALDIGCGGGDLLRRMLDDGLIQQGVGIDLCRKSVARATASHRMSELAFQTGDAQSLDFDDGSFDLITCTEVIEHLPDRQAAIAEWSRVLRPGGVLVISCPYYYNLLLMNKLIGDTRLAFQPQQGLVPFRWSPWGPMPYEHRISVRSVTANAKRHGLVRRLWFTSTLQLAVQRSWLRLACRALLGSQRYWSDDFYPRAMASLSRFPITRHAGYKLYMAFEKA